MGVGRSVASAARVGNRAVSAPASPLFEQMYCTKSAEDTYPGAAALAFPDSDPSAAAIILWITLSELE